MSSLSTLMVGGGVLAAACLGASRASRSLAAIGTERDGAAATLEMSIPDGANNCIWCAGPLTGGPNPRPPSRAGKEEAEANGCVRRAHTRAPLLGRAATQIRPT